METTSNAKISGATIVFDGKCITARFNIECSGCLVTKVNIPIGEKKASAFRGMQHGMDNMVRMMELAGASCWEGMNGKFVRVGLENGFIFNKINKIGHLVEDKWVDCATNK